MSKKHCKPFEYSPMRLAAKEINFPFKVIDDFFEVRPIKEYRKYISSLLKASYGNSYWTKDDPAILLQFYENLSQLIEAAYIIYSNQSNEEVNGSLLADPGATKKEIIELTLYSEQNAPSANWDFFPRYVSEKEFINPYCVFIKFFQYHSLPEWRKELYNIVYYALISDSSFSCGENIDYLSIYLLLQKLVEAAHLIQVRENNRK